MSVFKECYYVIDQIKKQSCQIYSDACDFGAPVRIEDKLWNMVAQIVDENGIISTRSSGDWGVSIKIKTMDEVSGDTEYYLISYCKTNKGKCKGYDGYFVVYQTEI